MTRIILPASVASSAVSFAIGYASAGRIFFAFAIAVIGAIWLYTQLRGLKCFSTLGLTLAVLAAAIGIMLGVAPLWMFAGVSFSLFAWDWIEFHSRLQFASSEDSALEMEKRHLQRFGILALAGIALLIFVTFVRLQLGLWLLIFLAFLFAFGLARLIWQFRR